jgi:hypothetical protein
MREKKYIEFLKDIDIPGGREKYIKTVKYRILDETSDKYVVSIKKNITFSKSREGELFITGRM